MALPENPGLAVSIGAHTAFLALALLSFSRAPQPGDMQETIPVAIISGDQLSEIMHGEKTAPQVRPIQRAEKIAEKNELSSQPSPSDARRDISQSPSSEKRQNDPGQAEIDEAHPAQHSAAPAPPRPSKQTAQAGQESEAAKQSVPPPPVQPDDDAIAAAAKPSPPKELARPAKKPEPKFKPDQVAKLLDQEKQKEKQKPAAKPKSGDEAIEARRKFDLGDIAKFLNKEQPQRKQASGHEFSQLASLGSPTASAAKMSLSLWDQLDGLLQEQYKRCWNFIGRSGQQKYVPEIHVQYTPEGALIGEPQLLNPPSDPNLRALAESAMRAVRRCDPLRIPAQFQPYYEQWRGRIVRFDPEEML